MPELSKKSFEDIAYSFDERRIRLWCAVKARSYNKIYGRGGITSVHKATHVPHLKIHLGIKEIQSEEKLENNRIRKSEGERKKVAEKQAKAEGLFISADASENGRK